MFKIVKKAVGIKPVEPGFKMDPAVSRRRTYINSYYVLTIMSVNRLRRRQRRLHFQAAPLGHNQNSSLQENLFPYRPDRR